MKSSLVAILSLTAAPCSEAFAFTGTSLRSITSTSSTTSQLQMNLFDRFSRVAKSNLNNILQNLEDPEKIMNQAVEDMQVIDWLID